MSEDDYLSLDETVYLLRSPENAKRLSESIHRKSSKRHLFNSVDEIENELRN